MSLYQRARTKEEKVFLSLTGSTFAEFDELRPFFQAAWEEARNASYQQDPSRQRKPGGGNKPALKTHEERLFFILYYLKTYPLQEVMAFHFEMSQGQAHEWIYRLTRLLRTALEAVLKPLLAVARLQSPWIRVAQKGPYRQDMTPFRRLAHDDFARA